MKARARAALQQKRMAAEPLPAPEMEMACLRCLEADAACFCLYPIRVPAMACSSELRARVLAQEIERIMEQARAALRSGAL